MNTTPPFTEQFVHTWLGAGVAWSFAVGWGLRHASPPAAVAAFLISIPLVSLLVTCDLVYRVLPRWLSYSTFAAMAPLLVIAAGPSRLGHWGAVAGAAGMYTMTVVVDHLAGGVLGRGDIHFSPLIGLVVGWFEPRQVITVWLVAAVIAAGLALVDRERGTLVPYGPLFAIGASVAIVVAT